jgi:cyclic pyranopterin phosphate synthase
LPVDSDASQRPDPGFSHLDARGRARMVDVSAKADSVRVARARAIVDLDREVRDALREGTLAKGDGLAVARVAGIQAAKRTAELIPLCHPLPLTAVRVELEPEGEISYRIEAEVRCVGPTGVEMEALTAVTVAALALYDMCKGRCRGIRIREVVLLEKSKTPPA